MKNFTLIISAIVFCSFTCFSQDSNQDTLERYETEFSSITEHLDLFYSVQIGNFKHEVDKSKLASFDKIVLYKTAKGSTKYLAGIFPNINSAVETNRLASELGFDKPFITAYYQGKKITMVEAEKIRLGENY